MAHFPNAGTDRPEKTRSPLITRLFSSTALIGMAICVLLTATAVAATGGVIAGEKERDIRATETTTVDIDIQLALGLQDFDQGRYQLAAQRFRWILERVPDHAEAAAKLAEAERLMNEALIVPTLPPIDTDDPEELFVEAEGFYNSQEWQNAITRLEELQRLDPRYREVEVKDMLFNSLKALGLSYIRGDRLEEGIFMLERAGDIQPLDDQTQGEQYLASLYVAGQTYWSLNWLIVIENYQIIYDIAPNYREGELAAKLREARIKYAEQLNAQGSFCGAASQYEIALTILEDDLILSQYEQAAQLCQDNPQGGTPQTAAPQTGTPQPGLTTTPGISLTNTGGSGTQTYPTAAPTYGPSPTPTITPMGLFP
jgi:tetratricopeptide (TPR) repeat protein